MRFMRLTKQAIRRLKSEHWIYLLLHLVLLFIGLLLVVLGGTIKIAVGASLIAAAMAGCVLFLRIWLSQDEIHLWEIHSKFGLIRVFEHRSIAIKHEYDTRLEVAREAIDVIGFGLRSLRQDYWSQFPAWATQAKVRILLLDPEFITAEHSLANQRDKEENDSPGTIAQDVREFARKCSDLLKDNQNFQVRLYRCLPLVNIFRIDGALFWGPYIVGDVSRNLPTFLTEEGGILYARMLKHFDEIWSTFSRPIPSEWLDADATAGAG